MGVQEAEQMRESDEKRRESVQLRNDGETLCYQVEKQMSDLKDKISTADADDLKAKMSDLRQAMAEDSPEPESIRTKTKDLQEASWKVTQQAYQQGSSSNDSSDTEKKDSSFERRSPRRRNLRRSEHMWQGLVDDDCSDCCCSCWDLCF